MIQWSNVRKSVLMNGQIQVRIYQSGKSPFGLLGLWGADKWKQYQKQRTLSSTNTIRPNASASRQKVTLPITPTQKSGIGAPMLRVWNRGLRLQRSKGWHQLEPTQEVGIER